MRASCSEQQNKIKLQIGYRYTILFLQMNQALLQHKIKLQIGYRYTILF